MFKIQTLNNIAEKGLSILKNDGYTTEADISDPDGILVRSQKMHDMELGPSLKAIARAGAGVNNIPIDHCSDRGIVVFNTPGANANSVKELVLSGLLLSSRKIQQGLQWTQTLSGKGSDVTKLVEKQKSSFAGPEIAGKTLGVVGLGAIGVIVSNAATALGMEVIGYDPFISVESAWGLSRSVNRARSLESLYSKCDYITIHVPLNEQTSGMLNAKAFGQMKKGVRILNFARGPLVNNADIIDAVDKGIVSAYVTDFPEDELLGHENILCVPHLGASTPEAEENCAVMAANQIKDFLETGNITNSVNFPECRTDATSPERLVVANRNIPNMVGQITAVLAEENINILDMLNKHRDELAYNIINIDRRVTEHSMSRIKEIEGVIMVRAFHFDKSAW